MPNPVPGFFNVGCNLIGFHCLENEKGFLIVVK